MTAPAHLRDSPLLRRWQMRALQAYVDADARDFLVTATPGSGKTTYALSLAGRLLAQRVVQRVIVVVPTDHLRGQWADAAAKAGLWLDPTLPNSVGPVREGTLGYVATYAQVAAKPMLHRGRAEARPTLVIMDEIGMHSSRGHAICHRQSPMGAAGRWPRIHETTRGLL